MGNIFLILTIVTETAAVICMKLSAGFNNKLYSVTALISYGLSFLFLTLALKSLPAGYANAIWAGTSTVLVAVISILLFKERLNTVQMISMMLIVAGLVGLNWKGSSI